MRKFKVWDPDAGEEEADAVEIEAYSAGNAAEIRAARIHDGEECFDLVVRDGDKVYDVTVDVEVEWSFSGFVTLRK